MNRSKLHHCGRRTRPVLMIACTISMSLAGVAQEAAKSTPRAELIKPLPSHQTAISKNVSIAHELGLAATIGVKEDQSALVWEIATGRVVFATEVPFQTGNVLLTPDGQQLLVAPSVRKKYPPKGEVQIARFDVKTGDALAPLTLPIKVQLSLMSSSADGKFLAAAHEKSLWVWRLSDSKLVFNKEYEVKFNDIQYAPDGRSILACGIGTIHQIGLPKGEQTVEYDRGRFHDAGVSPDGLRGGIGAGMSLSLIPGSKQFLATYIVKPGYHRIGHWEIGKPGLIGEGGWIKGNYISRQLHDPVISIDGKHLLATGSFSGAKGWCIKLSFPGFEEIPKRFMPERGVVKGAAFDADPKRLLTFGNREARRWTEDADANIGGYSLVGHAENPSELITLPGDRAISAGSDNVVLWDLDKGSIIRAHTRVEKGLSTGDRAPLSPIASVDGETLWFLMGGNLVTWDVSSWKEKKRIPMTEIRAKSLQIDPNGSEAICWFWKGDYQRVNLEKESVEDGKLALDERERIQAIDASLGTALVLDSGNKLPSIWNLATGERTKTFTVPPALGLRNNPSGVGGKLLPDGKTAVTWSRGGTAIYIWDIETAELRHQIICRGGSPNVILGEDGNLLVVADSHVQTIDPTQGTITPISKRDPMLFRGKIALSKSSGRLLVINEKGNASLWEIK